MPADLLAITLLTLKVAGVATLAMLPVGTALGFALARCKVPGRPIIESVLLMPMILPPVAVGLALLWLLRPDGAVGTVWQALTDERLLLSWQAAAVASFTVALPLFIKAAQSAFLAVPTRLEQVAATMGLSSTQRFFRVTLPLALPGLGAGLLLAFARALGEFGATSIVAGTIPGRTETLALGIYTRINSGHDQEAWILAGASILLAVAAVAASHVVQARNWSGK